MHEALGAQGYTTDKRNIGIVEALRLIRQEAAKSRQKLPKPARAKVHAFTLTELAIIRKGLDPVVPDAEVQNAAYAFFKSLRKRKASYYDLFNENLK